MSGQERRFCWVGNAKPDEIDSRSEKERIIYVPRHGIQEAEQSVVYKE